MLSFQNIMLGFWDYLIGHLMLLSYLLAMTDEQAIWKRLKKLPPLLLSPFIAILITLGLYMTVPKFGIFRYFISSIAILAMYTLWVMWAWRQDFWWAFSSTCMAGILQVATSALIQILFQIFPSGLKLDISAMAIALLFSMAAAVLLKWLHIGAWFLLLLTDQPNLHRTAAFIFALEISVEAFLILQNGIQRQYLAAYYGLGIVLVLLIIGLIIYLAHRFDDSRLLKAQQDIIFQQRLYEQNLEDIRQEIHFFRHDYKNLLAALSKQAEGGKVNELHSTIKKLDADFDQRLNEKIQLSVQIGNLRIPQIRNLLLNKITDMREKGVECRLEVLYPVETIIIDVWDLIRCLGVLIDNATEAALDVEHPWVEIVFLVQGKRMFLRISNPYKNTIDSEKIWEDGWSTKGTGRGRGLSSYQRILKRYPNVSTCTSWENHVFAQELTMEDMP